LRKCLFLSRSSPLPTLFFQRFPPFFVVFRLFCLSTTLPRQRPSRFHIFLCIDPFKQRFSGLKPPSPSSPARGPAFLSNPLCRKSVLLLNCLLLTSFLFNSPLRGWAQLFLLFPSSTVLREGFMYLHLHRFFSFFPPILFLFCVVRGAFLFSPLCPHS